MFTFLLFSSECTSKSGTSAGTCAQGFGVCCTCKLKLSRGEICVANFMPMGLVRVIISCQKVINQLFSKQKRAIKNSSGSQTCKFFSIDFLFWLDESLFWPSAKVCPRPQPKFVLGPGLIGHLPDKYFFLRNRFFAIDVLNFYSPFC